MDEQHLKKLREDRLAREKARIEKLRDLNLKKYGKSEPSLKPSSSNTSIFKRPVKTVTNTKNNASNSNGVKNNVHMNGLNKKRPISAPTSGVTVKNVASKKIVNTVNNANKLVVNNKSDKPMVHTKIWDVSTKITEKNTVKSEKNTIATKKVETTTSIDKTLTNDKTETTDNETNINKMSSTSNVRIRSFTNEPHPQRKVNPSEWNQNLKNSNRRSTFIGHANETVEKRNMSHKDAKTDIRKMDMIKTKLETRKTINPSKLPQSASKVNSFKTKLSETRKTIDPSKLPQFVSKVNSFKTKLSETRKTVDPSKLPQSTSKLLPKRQSVFERLYQNKQVTKEPVNVIQNLQTNPDFLKQVIKDSQLVSHRRQTVFEQRKTVAAPVRRSISAVHFKRIGKNEIANCIHKWSSIGEKLDKIHLKEINEDEPVKQDAFISAVKSERKKVSFRTPLPPLSNTPRPEELQERLQKWLQKRGKSIDSYHHLQCFGIHHLNQTLKPFNYEAKHEQYDDEENKENVPLESDSDNESYEDNMNKSNDTDKAVANDRSDDFNDRNDDFYGRIDDFNEDDKDKWRRASNVTVADSVEDIQDYMQTSMMSSTESPNQIDDLLLGALNDLTELLREGFDRDQCARWLRAMRDRFPSAPDSAAYWECRAALEESRGDLPTSIQCWEEAIAKGTEHSVAEANLDQLLDKFMQLKISPNGVKKQVDPKLVDVKNIFKSTIIRFAVQQAKLRQATQTPPKYICTPVRRSGRLSARYSEKRTPLRVCATVKQAGLLAHPLVFVPNDKLSGTP